MIRYLTIMKSFIICVVGSFVFGGCKDNEPESISEASPYRKSTIHVKTSTYENESYDNPDYTETGKVHGRINEIPTERLGEEINKVVVRYVELDDIPIRTAFDYLIQIGSQTHPDAPFRFPFDLSSATLDKNAMVTIHGRNIPYDELISEVCEQGNLRWEIKQGRIVIENK